VTQEAQILRLNCTNFNFGCGTDPHGTQCAAQGLIFGWLGVLFATMIDVCAVGFWTYFRSWFPFTWNFSLTWATHI